MACQSVIDGFGGQRGCGGYNRREEEKAAWAVTLKQRNDRRLRNSYMQSALRK
jgi:hypothetical protein